jgi:hypothetical protein
VIYQSKKEKIMHNLKLMCINNELVVIDANTDKPIGYLTYNRSFINATLELKATVMEKIPVSAQERTEQYKKDYYQPPQKDHPPKPLQLHEPNKDTSQNLTNSNSDSLSAKNHNSSVESESTTKDIVHRISALSELVSKVKTIQNTPITDENEVKPMLVRLSPQASKLTTTPTEKIPCPCCNGTGAFVKGKITRTCFRCDCKGYMDDADRKRYAAYVESRGYANKTTYKDHNNKYTVR